MRSMKDAVLKLLASIENVAANLAKELHEFAQISHIEGTERGVKSLALDDNNIKERIEVIRKMESMGLQVRVDPIGNIFGIYPGKRGEQEVVDEDWVLTGSHTDTVITGGEFDGRLGVLGGLKVIEAVQASVASKEIEPPQDPIVVADWVAEEGARYSAMAGSAYFTGKHAENYLLQSKDKIVGEEGITFGESLEKFNAALKEAHTDGTLKADYSKKQFQQKPGNVKASCELHIEQGPVLDRDNKEVEIVTHVLGISQRLIDIKPADGKDAIAAAFDVVTAVRDIAKADLSAEPRGTVGMLNVPEGQKGKLTEPTSHQLKFDIASISNHAGGCPMYLRRDSGYAAAIIYQAAYEVAAKAGKADQVVINPDIQYGVLDTTKTPQSITGVINQVPDHVSFCIGLKDQDPDLFRNIGKRIDEVMADLTKALPGGEQVEIKKSEAQPFDKYATAVQVSADLRNNAKDLIDQADVSLDHKLQETADKHGAEIESKRVQRQPEVRFNQKLIDIGHKIMNKLGYPHGKSFTLGAGHDSCNISEWRDEGLLGIPTVMVTCRNMFGSHNVKELAEQKGISAGMQVIANIIANIAFHNVDVGRETSQPPVKESAAMVKSFHAESNADTEKMVA